MAKKRKLISYVLVFTLFLGLIAPINGLKVVRAEDTSDSLTYEQLKDAANTLLEKVSTMDAFERTVAIAVLKNYAKVTDDVDGNGIDDGIDELSNIVRNLDTDDTFPSTLTDRVVSGLAARGISLEQAAKAVMLLSIWDANDRITLVESLDSEYPVKLFNNEEEEFINDLLAKSPETVDLLRGILQEEGITLNEFTFFAFAAKLAIGQPIFTDDPADGLLMLIDDNRLEHVKNVMNISLEGLTIRGRTFNASSGTVDQIFNKGESVLKRLLTETDDVNACKEIFAKYDLYQSSESTIKLVPVYSIIGKDQKAVFDIVLRNVQENINSLQFNITYNDFLRFSEFKVLGQAIAGSLETNDYIAVLDTDNPSIIAFGITYLDGGSIPKGSEVKIATVSFTGNAVGLGDVNFDDGNFIALDPDNNQLNFPLNSYGAVVEVREVTDVVTPEITKVYLDDEQVFSGEEATINTQDFTVGGFVSPKTSTVKVNNQNVDVDGVTGKFTYNFTDFTGGSITITATNENLTEQFTFSVIVDQTGPVISVDGVEDNRVYSTDKQITFTAGDAASITATLNGAAFNSGSSTATPDNTEEVYNLVVIAVDEAGNETTSTISFTVDKEVPVIEGVEEGQVTNDQFTPTSAADDIETVILKKNGVQQLKYSLGTAITAEGDYVLTVIDKAGNESTVSFTIDKSALVITGVVNGEFTNQDVTPVCLEADKAVLVKNGSEDQNYQLGNTLTDEGTYELTVTDIAGNSTTVTFTIDKTAPTAAISYSITDATNQDVIAALINPSEEITVTNNNGLTTHTFTTNGTFIFQFEDLAGNAGEATATVDYIDKTPPAITFNNLTNNENYATITPDVDTGDAANTGVELLKDGDIVDGYALGEISDAGYYILTVTATDAVGNSSEKSISFFVGTDIAPIIEFTNIKANAYYSSITPEVELNEGSITEIVLTKDDVVVAGYAMGNITEDGYYTLTVTAEDEAGNTSNASISFYIDATAPEITFDNVTEGEYYQQITPEVSLTEGNITTVTLTKGGVNVAGYELGEEITEDGDYTLTVNAADEVNTFSQSVSFHIDSTPPVISVYDNSIANDLVQVDPVTPTFTITDATESTLLYTIEKTVDETTNLNSGEVNADAQGYYVVPEISEAADYRLIVKAVDAVGNMSQEVVYTFVIAEAAMPSGSLKIVPKEGSSQDPEFTNNTTVDLELNVLNTASIEVSNTEDFTDIESYQVNNNVINLEWDLTAVNADSTEIRTVYVKLLAENGSEVVLSDSITVDKDAPVITSVQHTAGKYLKSGDAFTISAQLDNPDEIVKEATVELFDGTNQSRGKFTLETGFGGYLFYNYTVPADNEFTIDKLVFNVTDKAGNALVNDESVLANKIEFMGSAKVVFNNASSNPVSNLRFNLFNDDVFRSGTIYNTNEYIFKDLPVGSYTIEWFPLSDEGSYKDGQGTIIINSGAQTTQTITVEQKPLGTLNVLVQDDNSNGIGNVPVYLYSTSNVSYWNTLYTDSEGKVTFDDLPLDDSNSGEFAWYTYAGTYANTDGRVTFNGTNSKDLTITLQSHKVIKGRVLGEGGVGLQNVEVWASGSSGWASTRTDANGNYTLRGLNDNDTYTVGVYAFSSASDGKNYLYKEKGNLTAQNEGAVFGEEYNFNLTVASKIEGTVTKLTNPAEPAANVYVRAEPVNQNFDANGWPTWGWATTDENGHFVMDGLKPGDYKVIIDYVQGFEYYSETVTVAEAETLTHNPELRLKGGDKAFYGEGNSLRADKDYVAPGGIVNFVVNYKNNNTIPLANPTIKVELPQGFTFVGSSSSLAVNGNIVTKDLGAVGIGQEGSFSFAAKAVDVVDGQTYTAAVKGEWAKSNTTITETFGVSSVEALSVTLNGPDKVATNIVKLYGEASSDAEVYIYMDGELKKVVKASGKYWSTDVELETVGVHTFYAKSKKGTQVSNATEELTIKYSRNLLALEKSTITAGWNGTVEVNPRIGIVTMSVSQGQTMIVKAKIPANKGIDVNSDGVTFTFAGKEYKAQPKADNWYQAKVYIDYETSGTKKLVAKFTDTNGIPESYSIPIANIIILVDPSGYVYDAVEGEDTRIPGITMTLDVYEDTNGDGAADAWRFWNAAMFGQVNPQTTTDEGRYGWDVPGGPDESSPIYYKVKAVDPNGKYAAYTTDKQAKWKDNDTGIAVPPPRFDVNIGLIDQAAPKVVSSSPAANETGIAIDDAIQITFSKKMDKSLVEAPGNIKVSVVGGAEVSGTVTYDEATKVATFTPDNVLDDSTKYQVFVSKAIESAHGITAAINADYAGDYKTYIDQYNKPLADNVTWTFTTAVTQPAVTSIDPVGGATDVSINENIVVTFNKKMDATSLTATTVKLKNGSSEVSSTLSYDSSTRKLTINPDSALSNSTQYQLEIKGAKDTKGNALPDYTSTFTTEAAGGGGSGDGGGYIAPTPTSKDIAKVDNKGGKVSLLDGKVSIQIAEGTFGANVNITVEKVDEKDVALPQTKSTSRFIIAGEIFDLDAGGVDFDKPVSVTFKYDPEKIKATKNTEDQDFDPRKLGVYYYNTQTGQWDYVGGKVDINNGTVTIELNHFSKYAVMYYDKTFTDIPLHWAKNDIELMASRHIAKGISETNFGPDIKMTRAQFAALLLRVLGLQEEQIQASSFTDVPLNAWYASAVETAFKAGLVGGISQTEFAPEANITREQMAVMIMRAYSKLTGTDYEKLKLTTKQRFADESAISSWAHQAVILANDLKIVGGMTETTFVPKADATRAQGVVMIKRLLEATNSF